MKTNVVLKKIYTTMIVVVLFLTSIQAQWNFGNNPDANTNGGVQTVGIGAFLIPGAVRAILQVNSFYTATSTYTVSPGDLLRTDGINTSINEWTMYLGPNPNTTMFGRLLVDPIVGGTAANPQDFILNATDPAGNLEFWTAGATNYSTNMEMIILGNAGVTNGYVGIGKGFATPNYHLDIVGNYIGDGVNVSDPAALVHNAVGYSIGGGGAAAPQIFAWHSGDITSCYLGINAGFTAPAVSYSAFRNTAVGNQALTAFNANPLMNGTDNIAIGFQSMLVNTTGFKNVVMGNGALSSSVLGDSNVAVGFEALKIYFPPASNLQNRVNTAVGFQAGLNQQWVGPANGGNNTYIGELSGAGLTVGFNNNGTQNTAEGSLSFEYNTTGYDNVANGFCSLKDNTIGFANTATGWQSALNNTGGEYNCAFGYWALDHNTTGDDNTAIGAEALLENGGLTPGNYNTATGMNASYGNTSGEWNTSDGFDAMRNNSANPTTGDSNTAVGTYSFYNIVNGHGNGAFGAHAGYNVNIPPFIPVSDFDNLFLGSWSDRLASASQINGATAVGTSAIVAISNQLELGNNANTVTIGLSGYPYTIAPAQTNLEIATEHSPWPLGWSTTATGINYYGPPAGPLLTGTGTSGLRFDDLTSKSLPVSASSLNFNTSTNPFPTGMLSVDGYGNVIMIPLSAGGSGTGIGYCGPTCGSGSGLTSMTGSGGYNLNTHNFYFDGNASLSSINNCVIIGKGCCSNPNAKLDVLQNSGAIVGSIGIYDENDNHPTSLVFPTVIGLRSYVKTHNPSCTDYTCAGWFEAPGQSPLPCYSHTVTPVGTPGINYAIFVPNNGGGVDIGYAWNGHKSYYSLDVNGWVGYKGLFWYSDSILKKNIHPFNSGIKVLRKINPVSFKYNGKCNIDTNGTCIGLIAENVAMYAPYAVDTVLQPLDSTSVSDTTILKIYHEAILFTAINAIKQVDSTVSKHDSNTWHTTGNMGITSANFLGAIDSTNLFFKTNNIESGLIDVNNANTAFGHQALFADGSGEKYNVAFGSKALVANTTGNCNTAGGTGALISNNGGGNTAFGDSSLVTNTSGSYNTALGYLADVNSGSYTNSTAIGYGATATASNYIAIGNTSVTTIAGQVNYSIYSDKRVKTNVQENVPGLSFIKLLKPVTYNYNIDKENEITGAKTISKGGKTALENTSFSGFIAQDVETAANQIGYNFSGVVKPQNGNDLYSLRYSEFVVPLVKAVQEQQSVIDSLKKQLQDMQTCVAQLCNSSNNPPSNPGSPTSTQSVTLSGNGNVAILYQNRPNPYEKETAINYFLPEGTMGAKMLFFDSYGSQLKSVDLIQTGNGTLNVSADNLAAGIYTYSLVVDNKVIDTKRMILQK